MFISEPHVEFVKVQSLADFTPPISQEFVSVLLTLATCSEHKDLI